MYNNGGNLYVKKAFKAQGTFSFINNSFSDCRGCSYVQFRLAVTGLFSLQLARRLHHVSL